MPPIDPWVWGHSKRPNRQVPLLIAGTGETERKHVCHSAEFCTTCVPLHVGQECSQNTGHQALRCLDDSREPARGSRANMGQAGPTVLLPSS